MTFPTAQDVATVTNDTSTEAAKRATICAAIWTAVETPGTVTTSSLDMSALSLESLIMIVKELEQQGYGVTLGASQHITITWPAHP